MKRCTDKCDNNRYKFVLRKIIVKKLQINVTNIIWRILMCGK